MKKLLLFALLFMVASSVSFAGILEDGAAPQPALKLDDGSFVPNWNNAMPFDEPVIITESPGEQLAITYQDQQHNASLGHQIAIDDQGGIHVVWMHSDNANIDPRRVKYTYSDGMGGGWLEPVNADPGQRSGYTVLALKTNASGSPVAVPVYHTNNSGTTQTQFAVDALTGFGAFSWYDVDLQSFPAETIIWPKAAISGDGVGHVISQDNPASPEVSTMYYSRSQSSNYSDGFAVWDLLDETVNRSRLLSYAVDASKTSQKVVRAFLLGRDNTDSDNSLSHQVDCDVYFQSSTDGGQTWGEMLNVTNYDFDFDGESLVDPTEADFDSMFWRAGYTVEIHLDVNDVAHITWSAIMKTLPDENSDYGYTYDLSQVMHWDDQREVMDMVYNDWLGNPILDSAVNNTLGLAHNIAISDWTGAFKSTSCAPTIGSDDQGNLYMTFNKFFADDFCALIDGYGNESNGHIYNGEIMAIMSTDGGATWFSSEGENQPVNLTNSPTPECEVGECDDDRYPTLAKRVTSDGDGTYTAHLFYINDKAAGRWFGGAQEEGPGTPNPVKYLAIPTEDIMGTNAIEDDSDDQVAAKSSFLHQNSPNPFANTTAIRYSLPTHSNVELTIYNEAGQLVKTLVQAKQAAGDHEMVWDGTNQSGNAVSAGVYFYRLKANDNVESRRMVLLR